MQIDSNFTRYKCVCVSICMFLPNIPDKSVFLDTMEFSESIIFMERLVYIVRYSLEEQLESNELTFSYKISLSF